MFIISWEAETVGTKVSLSREKQIAFLTFYEEQERKPCTLDWDVLRSLDGCLGEIEASSGDVRVVIVESKSPKAFLVGANIAALEELDTTNIMEWVRLGHRVFNRLSSLPVPVIAKVKNMALGGGLELAMACDFIVAGESAVLGQPEASLGVMPGWGGSCRLAVLAGPARAKELFMTGQRITARQAYEWGIVNHVCPMDVIDQFVLSLAEQIMANDKQVIAFIKERLNNAYYGDIFGSAAFEAISSSVCLASAETRKRLSNFFSKRKNK